ncbi:hypothetical protein [Paenibacillus caseinilyticus]|nr:hypothetical protein [Paenibacillus caseinilyticus]MCZ8522655.1 hypothetical protein [Paenibacillus caseinilyticus]
MNPTARHLLYTNASEIPSVDGFDLNGFLRERLGVEVVRMELTYRTPPGYYGSWKNQFYLFDILKSIAAAEEDDTEPYLVLDSDCVWLRSAGEIEKAIGRHGLLTMTADVDHDTEFVMNGLSRRQMKGLYEELLGHPLPGIPYYYGGEWFAANAGEFRRVMAELGGVWEQSMQRFAGGKAKFNEEAQMLSYVYDKLGYESRTANVFIKRIWTQLTGFNNVEEQDRQLTLWHLPSEKKLGIARLYAEVIREESAFWQTDGGAAYVDYMAAVMGVPKRSVAKTLKDARALIFHKLLQRVN